MDNGPEYISGKLLIWAEKRGITIQHIQPGQPQQNAYIERYNRTVRHEWLDQYIIETIEEAQSLCHAMAMDLQQRPPQHGHRRHHTRTETENGCVSSTNAPR